MSQISQLSKLNSYFLWLIDCSANKMLENNGKIPTQRENNPEAQVHISLTRKIEIIHIWEAPAFWPSGENLWAWSWKLYISDLQTFFEKWTSWIQIQKTCRCALVGISRSLLQPQEKWKKHKTVDFQQQQQQQQQLCIPEASSSVLCSPPGCSSNCCKLSEHYRPLHALRIKHSTYLFPLKLPRHPGEIQTSYLLGFLWRFTCSRLFFWKNLKPRTMGGSEGSCILIIVTNQSISQIFTEAYLQPLPNETPWTNNKWSPHISSDSWWLIVMNLNKKGPAVSLQTQD